MNQETLSISTIAEVKESESPENPSGLEKRVAMIPEDIKVLVDDSSPVEFDQPLFLVDPS